MSRNPKCRWVLEIPEYLLNRLPQPERERMAAHLVDCKRCAQTYAEFREVLQRLSSTADSQSLSLLKAPKVLEIARARRLRQAAAQQRIRAVVSWAAGLTIMISAWFYFRAVTKPNAPHEAALPRAEIRTASESVNEAVRWLAQTQEPDGSWDPMKWGAQSPYRCGITALALLACATASNDVAMTTVVSRAADFLMAQQQADGRLGPLGSCTPYNHALGTLALLEVVGLESDTARARALDRALTYIRSTQRPCGAWDYPRRTGDTGNSSITLLNIYVLQQLRARVPQDVQPHLEKAYAWIQQLADAHGRVGYRRAGDFPFGHETLTAAALFCVSMAPAERQRLPVQKMFDLITTAETPADYYRSYFFMLALRRVPTIDPSQMSPQAAHMVARIRETLGARQEREGPLRGSWAPNDRWGSAGGRVYATAMAVLTLTEH